MQHRTGASSTGRTGSRRVAEWALGVCVVAALLATQALPFAHGRPGDVAQRLLARSDFGAFYCAALVARTGGDPYALAPLKRCEIDRVYAPGGVTYAEQGIDLAPLPEYDFALFAPLTYLPYSTAGLLWVLILVAATLAGAEGLRRLTRLPYFVTLSMLAFAGGTVAYAYGQEGPLVTLALVGGALRLRADRPVHAVWACAPSLLEPHVGLPVMLGLLVWTRARAAVAVVLGGAALLSLAFGGLNENLAYVTRVLPVHAFAEVPVHMQYSLTSILYLLGLPDAAALRVATFQYALTVVAGVAAAGPLARRIGTPVLVLLPATCAVFGGTFVHITQIASALPFALFLAGCVPGVRAAGWAAAALIALPWPAYGYDRPLLLTDALVILTAAAAATASRPPALRAAVALGALALYAATPRLYDRLPAGQVRAPEPAAAVTAAGYPADLASTQWALEARTPTFEDAAPRWIATRVPTWLGLALALAAAAVTGLRRRR